MILYVDSSIVLRVLFNEARPLMEWRVLERGYSSVLLGVEVARALSRASLEGVQDADLMSRRQRSFARLGRKTSMVPITEVVIAAASQPLPLVVKSLDAIHIATALDVLASEPDLVFATHDRQQAAAATTLGLKVIGI